MLSTSSSRNSLDMSLEAVTVAVEGVWDENSNNFEFFDESFIMDKMVEKLNTDSKLSLSNSNYINVIKEFLVSKKISSYISYNGL